MTRSSRRELVPFTSCASRGRGAAGSVAVTARRRRLRLVAAAAAAALVGASAAPLSAAPALDLQIDGPAVPLHLELPLFDAPANVQGHYTFPSMEQSKWIATDLYQLAHFAAARLLGRRSWYGLLVVSAFDAATIMISVPFFTGWQHEEWHRAVLMRRGIPSINPYYSTPSIPLLQPKSIQLKGAAIARLKREHPADYVRGLAAGMEGQYALAAQLEREAFFHDAPSVSSFIIGMSYVMTSMYMGICAADHRGTGDCVLWTDGLYFPGKPPHRGGRATTAGERSYLTAGLALSFLNFLDPFVFLIRDLRFGEVRWSAAVRHVPTSFGRDVRLDVYYRDPKKKLLFSAHNYINGQSWFPGLAAELVDHPVGPFWLGARSELWLQPADQQFRTSRAKPGAEVALRGTVPLLSGRLAPFVELSGKTPGWVTGNVFLEASLAARVGIGANVF